jgi:hypothetical protein
MEKLKRDADDPWEAHHWGASSRNKLVCGRSVWILTVVQSRASAAKSLHRITNDPTLSGRLVKRLLTTLELRWFRLDSHNSSGNMRAIVGVCQIKWPAAQEQVASEQAAILFKARDKLNQLASPATGPTIAYTLLVAPDAGGGRQFSSKDKAPFCDGYPHSFAR